MRLIAILLSLLANRYPALVEAWRGDGLFWHYFGMVGRYLPVRGERRGTVLAAALLLPPIVVVAGLQYLLQDRLLGLGELALGVWALIFAHGPGRVDDLVEGFVAAWRRGDRDEAGRYAAWLAGTSTVEKHPALAATAGLLWQTERRLLGPIFWYLVLGPVGAVGYRLAAMMADHGGHQNERTVVQVAEALMHALGWLPARATALAYGLAGSFVHALEGWRSGSLDGDNREVVVRAGLGALNDLPDGDAPATVEAFLRDARGLVSRGVLIWLAVVALLIIAGFLY